MVLESEHRLSRSEGTAAAFHIPDGEDGDGSMPRRCARVFTSQR
jgi:hypothetical protein